MQLGRIHSVESLGTLDGPGVRTVLFFQGCPLRCGYCHNPDSWATDGGQETTVAAIMARLRRNRPYFGNEGGVTFSGGEPLAQAAFAAELAAACAAEQIHVALDTSGCVPLTPAVRRAVTASDLIILDIKHPDPLKFRELTGGDLRLTLDLFAFTATIGKPVWVRQVIVPGWNDQAADMAALATLVARHPRLERVELLPYHRLGLHKWHDLGLTSPFAATPDLEPAKLAELQAQLAAARARESEKAPARDATE